MVCKPIQLTVSNVAWIRTCNTAQWNAPQVYCYRLREAHAGPIIESVAETALPIRQAITLRRARISRLLGMELPDAEITEVLTLLGMVVEDHAEGWRVTPPGFRFDIALEADLIEELARVHGYNQLAEQLHARRVGALTTAGVRAKPRQSASTAGRPRLPGNRDLQLRGSLAAKAIGPRTSTDQFGEPAIIRTLGDAYSALAGFDENPDS